MLTTQAYNDLLALAAHELDLIKQTLNQLGTNPAQGLRLWGKEGLYMRQAVNDTRIIYKLAGDEIQVLSIQPEASVVAKPAGRMNLSAVVLAAGHTGYSHTMPLAGVVDSFLAAGVNNLIVVAGDHADVVRHELQHKNVMLVVNSDYSDGLSKSLRYGLKMLHPDTRAVMLSLGNRPYITPEIVLSIIRTYKTSRAPLVVPTHSQMRGHPVLFDTILIPELMKTQGDSGGRTVIERHQNELAQIDIADSSILERIWAN
jgi:molybdenum cofactor cytidylyltransferase